MSETFKSYFDIQKVDTLKRIVYGKALVPDMIDSQDDYILKEDIEESAHSFLINLQKAYVELAQGKQTTDASQIGYMHKVFKGVGGFGYIVESYIDQQGSWVLATKITDEVVWQKILNKEINGYSVGGKGRRIAKKEDTSNV